MIVVLSSSSPIASVALIEGSGAVLAEGQQEAGHKASGTLLSLLEECIQSTGKRLTDARLFVADIGPGSFTGVKVCVTMAKSMAFAHSVPVAGVSAFDLIDQSTTVTVPSRKGEYFVRVPGQEPTIETHVPPETVFGVLPKASRAAALVGSLVEVKPELLVPLYVAEPSISKPRDPKTLGGPRA